MARRCAARPPRPWPRRPAVAHEGLTDLVGRRREHAGCRRGLATRQRAAGRSRWNRAPGRRPRSARGSSPCRHRPHARWHCVGRAPEPMWRARHPGPGGGTRCVVPTRGLPSAASPVTTRSSDRSRSSSDTHARAVPVSACSTVMMAGSASIAAGLVASSRPTRGPRPCLALAQERCVGPGSLHARKLSHDHAEREQEQEVQPLLRITDRERPSRTDEQDVVEEK